MSEDKNSFITIKNWREEDRPREKLLSKGANVLTDAELLAILLVTGYKETTAVDLAKILLNESGNDLEKLARFSVKQLSAIKGIGEAKAIAIIAALELGRRRKYADNGVQKKITGSKDAYDYMFQFLADKSHEEFYVLLLNRANLVTRHVKISQGGVSGTLVDNKIIFKTALEELSAGIIICHNHPSGNKNPSQEDINQTKRICDAGRNLDINVLDHIIFTNEGYFSFADEGMI